MTTNAQKLPLSMRVGVGVAHLPMSDWQSFIGHTPLDIDSYQEPFFTAFPQANLIWRIDKKHSIGLGIESLKPTRIRTGAAPQTNEILDTIGFAPYKYKYTFHGFPITIGYEFHTGLLEGRFEPVLGIGASYVISELKARAVSRNDFYESFEANGKRKGKGFGLATSIGFHSNISDKIVSIWQMRYRYSDGMYFTDHPGDRKVEFTGLDFSVALEYRF